ncbi:MAG: glycosyltransferase family 39 protein, partial [Acidobacteriia bacterium]|nr:glycosyltransferase family 39 protein [Terriglobia bacterium]
HLNIARRISDSRTPGYYQFGTVWLPLPHAAMALFAGDTEWWRNGLAGAIPSAAAFVLACGFLFAAVRRITGSSAAAWTGMALLALNPNALYLQSTAMTESYFFLSMAALLYWSVVAREKGSVVAAAAAGVAGCAGSLCRYEGWFLIPFVCLYLLTSKRLALPLWFGAIASLGPLYWLAHNYYFYSDALEFYHGAWSAKAIYERSLAAGMEPYAGDHDWAKAWLYYRETIRLTCGMGLTLWALVGVASSFYQKRLWPLLLLALPPAFYVWSMHSSGTPIFLPHLWPNSYYNTRYGLAALPLLAVAASMNVALVPGRWRAVVALFAVAIGSLGWLVGPSIENVICWKESERNSEARRAWTREAAGFLKEHYRGGGIAAAFGDLTGIFQQAGIPLVEILHEGNEPYWQGALARPDLFLREEWAVTFSGDPLATAIVRAQRKGPRYIRVKMIYVKGAPVVEIYQRSGPFTP